MKKLKRLYLAVLFMLMMLAMGVPANAASVKSGLTSYKKVIENKSQKFGKVTIREIYLLYGNELHVCQ